MAISTSNFISLQTNSNERRKVTIYFKADRNTCNLLGNLPHQTEFKVEELINFAHKILDLEQDLIINKNLRDN